MNTSGALVTIDTKNYQIDGKKGNWAAADTVIIDGKQFYLMEHQEYGNQARGVILDAYGKSLMNVNRDSMKKPGRKSMNIYNSMFHKILFISLDDRIPCVWNIIRNSMRMEPLKEAVSPEQKPIIIW